MRWSCSPGWWLSSYLDVKVAVPCDGKRRPIAGAGLFHEKAGIIEDAEGNRLAFSGSINETAVRLEAQLGELPRLYHLDRRDTARRGRGGELSAPLGRQGRQRHRHGRAGRGAAGAAEIPAEGRPAWPPQEDPGTRPSTRPSAAEERPKPESPPSLRSTGDAWSGASSGTLRAGPTAASGSARPPAR